MIDTINKILLIAQRVVWIWLVGKYPEMVGFEGHAEVFLMIRETYWNREQKETQRHQRDWHIYEILSLMLMKSVLLLGE